MMPDADAAASAKRADPFAPLTSDMLDVGDGHELYVESVGRADGIPAIYLHGGPGSGCQPDHRQLFDPERFCAVLFDQRGCGRSRPKGSREHNTTAHLIADMEKIREKFGFDRWMVVGGSWGATLALAYAEAHPERVSGIALRATFLGTRAEVETAFTSRLSQFYPALYEDFLSVLPPDERAHAGGRLLAPHPRCRSGRAWSGRAGLARHRARPVRAQAGQDAAGPRLAERLAHAAGDAVHGGALFRPRQLHDATTSCCGTRASSPAFPASSCRAATICCALLRHRERLAKVWPGSEIRIVEEAGHSLYDAGVRDAVMKSIADLASKAAR